MYKKMQSEELYTAHEEKWLHKIDEIHSHPLIRKLTPKKSQLGSETLNFSEQKHWKSNSLISCFEVGVMEESVTWKYLRFEMLSWSPVTLKNSEDNLRLKFI